MHKAGSVFPVAHEERFTLLAKVGENAQYNGFSFFIDAAKELIQQKYSNLPNAFGKLRIT